MIRSIAVPRSATTADPARLAGFSGFAMLAVILVNGPLAAVRGVPEYWSPGAIGAFQTFLTDPAALRLAAVFFFISTLIFVFGIPFFAGVRTLVGQGDRSGVVKGIVTVGATLFLAGGLVSEVLGAGMSTVVQAAPAYRLDVNAALGIQALQFAALIQGQVGLGVVMLAVSFGLRSGADAPRGLVTVGVIAGSLDLLRPLVVSSPPLAIGLFLPSFLWIVLASLALVRSKRTAD